MARWEPDSRARLQQAALDLYGEHGFEGTTVAEIAERAGLTERTFFRHFADKREVLFGGGAILQETIVEPVIASGDGVAPIDAVAAGLEAAARMMDERREFARRRSAIIAASAELRERELMKLASLSVAIAEALRARGVEGPTATLTGEVAIAVFRAAFARWIEPGNRRTFPELMRESLAQLTAVAAGS